jgi:hypothetical protein
MYLPHQIDKSDQLEVILRKHYLACLWGAPRSGKTRTAIRTVANLINDKACLVLTKKAAIPGWLSEIQACNPKTNFYVTNYEQAPKLSGEPFSMVIIDESHNLNKVGKMTQRFKNIRQLVYHKPVIFLTGTPAIEKQAGLFYQLGVSKFSPFQFKSFYEFFRNYGVSNQLWIGGRAIEQYDKVKPTLMAKVMPYVVSMTQVDAGITCEARDQVHLVTLSEQTKSLIDTISKEGVATINGTTYVFESDMAVRAAIHQIETGAVLLEGDIVQLPNDEVIAYIARIFGDKPDVALMAHFRSTRHKLAKALPRAHIYSSDGHAEGVNLAHYKHFVIVNSGYSGAKFVQRRERIVNINRTTEAIVHHIITDGGISEAVYNAVSNKLDYNLRLFRDARKRNPKENT